MDATTGPAIDLDPSARRRMMIRAVTVSAIGTTIEWYDFFLYGVAAALVFPQKFFPKADPFTGTLLSFSTFFVGFAARPVGAALFGHYGDRAGRKTLMSSRPPGPAPDDTSIHRDVSRQLKDTIIGCVAVGA